jgi:hypothetical protein
LNLSSIVLAVKHELVYGLLKLLECEEETVESAQLPREGRVAVESV